MGGIFSREQLDRKCKGKFSFTDDQRLDGELNGISISVTTPNSFMLRHKLRNGLIEDPIIIEIKPDILWDPNMRFIFCEGNAARKDKNKGSDYNDFKKMFQDDYPLVFSDSFGFLKSMTRDELYRSDNETTDEQAEILVEGKIPFSYIIGEPKPYRGY